MCNRHPKYKASRRPNANCMDCWSEYLQANPEKPILAKDVYRLLFATYGVRVKTYILHRLWKDYTPTGQSLSAVDKGA